MTTKEREVIKLMLEALQASTPAMQRDYPRHSEAIAAGKEALMSGTDGAQPDHIEDNLEMVAQPEQEPVATDWERIARVQDAKLRAMCDEPGGFEKLCQVMDNYERTAPPKAQPEQEPVEWLTGCPECGMNACECENGIWNPPKREWVGLTDEERDDIILNSTSKNKAVAKTEAKLKEKNT